MITDVVIIGGGASGLMCAVYLKKKCPSLSVRLLEALPRVGKKLSVTGNGRCNITNKKTDSARYHGSDVPFCEYALKKYDRAFCEEFFSSLGVDFVFEGDKGYPASLQASSVVDCLRFACDNFGVITHLETKVADVLIQNGNYFVKTGNMGFAAKNVVMASGLFSGGEKLGCDGSIYNLLKRAGYKSAPVYPSIVQLKTETDIVKQLKGIKTDASVSLISKGKTVGKDFGEVLFTDYGLSGPPILQLSGYTNTLKDAEISLDMMPHISERELKAKLLKRKAELSYLNLDEFLTGAVNKRIGQVIIKICGGKLSESVKTFSDLQIEETARIIKNFRFKVTGNTGFVNSQATLGGLLTSGFDRETMMSLSDNRLYAIGEILDITGDCGGFNLQWAWSSAICAAEAIIGENK